MENAFMEQYNPGQLLPQLIHVAEWKNKESFKHANERSPLWIIFIVVAGGFRFKIGKHQGTAGADDLLLCPPDTPFQREMLKPSTFLVANFNWYSPSGESVRSERQLTPDPTGKFMIQDIQRLASTHAHLLKAADLIDPFSRSRRNFLLQDLWQLFAWEWSCAQREKIGRQDDPLIRQAEKILRDNALKPFSMKALSGKFGLSAVQFTRRFKASFGMTPIDYLTAIRLNRVRTLLLETRLTLDEIAERCGYESGMYLSRIFSKKMSISPSQYRQGHRI
ncbi:helix-turn-helix transcriptional regulator [Paenibacillus hemerocallicola]|uniref:Helix-turn-helix transcriptional regulator n=2 Tax=Paenibacillus hemerocallicola TaxID=1172614 RepID=A0A5C4SZN3_9BACL|nr:helix-turn-helix transcriptional regulator [Paenibacillus hemerocallicola]